MKEQPAQEEVIDAADHFYGEIVGVKPFPRPPKKEVAMDHPRKGPKGRVSPVMDFVRSLGKHYRTTQEVADELGMSPNTIRNFSKNPDIKAPSYIAPFGKTYVRLYTPEDIEELRKYLSHRQPIAREEFERQQQEEGD